MKRFVLTLITALIFVSILPFTGIIVLKSDEYYSMACAVDEFEVSYIEGDGSFTKVSCHSSFDEAKRAMKANEDYVVRYSKSYSATKIVAMNSGLVYSYPGRRNSSTMTIYQDPSHRNDSSYKTTYVSGYYQMTYVDTCGQDVYDIGESGKGYVRVVLNGFEGFADLEYTDLVPFKFINKGIGIYLGGDHGGYCSYFQESPYYVKLEQDYYQIETKGNYKDLVYHYHQSYPSKNTDKALSYSWSVDNAVNYLNAGMLEGVKYYSDDGINFYSDCRKNNLIATCYNYYQFLSLRTVTDIPASTFDSFISSKSGSVMKDAGSSFINRQNKYGCNALIVYSMACLESAYGTSGYAVNRNNLFGWSAYDDSPDDASYFSSVDTCVKEQMGRNLNWFLDYSNRRYFGTFVGNKGAGINVKYASDPNWGAKIAGIAYSIDKYNNNNNGKLTDHNKYTLALVEGNYNDSIYGSNVSWNTPFYKSATGNDVFYTAKYGSHYQKDLIVAIVSDEGNRYKIQTANPVSDGNLVTEDGVLVYDWNASVAYVDKSKVKLLYQNGNETTTVDKKPSTYEPLTSLRGVTLNSNELILNGIGAIQGMDFNDPSKVTHEIVFISLADKNVTYTFNAENINSDGYSQNDGWDYTYTGFNLKITLPDENLPAGSYYVKLRTTNADKTVETELYSSEVSYRVMSSDNENQSYLIRMNDTVNYRLEIDVMSLPDEVDFKQISKPSARSSLVSLDSISLDDEGNLSINAHAYMYYINYDNPENIEYEVYLVDSDENYKKLDTVLYDDGIDYKTELQSKYEINNISFKAFGNIGLLAEGDYTIYVKMKNKVNDKQYLDINEIINYGFVLPEISIGNKNYQLYTSTIRRRIMLKVESAT